MTESVVEPAWAKINLTLRLTGRRGDGYHLLDSLVAFAETGDRLTYLPSCEPLALHVTGPMAPALAAAGGGGSVLRAAQALAEAAGIAATGQMRLDKHLPVAAGIGGGTADAAAALRLLARQWPAAAAIDLAALAPGLGADVPVCLASRPMRMTGIGETLTPVRVPPAAILLVNPGRPVATAAVFKARRGPFSAPLPVPDLPDTAALAAFVRGGGNDLQAAAISVEPAIAQLLAALESLPGCLVAAMSGSGGTCFGLFVNDPAARAAAADLRRRAPDWWITPSRLMIG